MAYICNEATVKTDDIWVVAVNESDCTNTRYYYFLS